VRTLSPAKRITKEGAARAVSLAVLIALFGTHSASAYDSRTTTTGSEPRTVITFDQGYCDIHIGNIHYSPNHRDASARTSVACYSNKGTGRPYAVDNIAIRTYLESTECQSLKNKGTDKATMPCHASFRGYGNYTASTNVRVTVVAKTYSASASATRVLP
jgi:hypothetical protein